MENTIKLENQLSIPKPKITTKRVLLTAVLLLAAALLTLQLRWTYSGSGQWEFEGEHNGVKLYSMKTPGDNIKKFKGTMSTGSSMSTLAAVMQDFQISEEAGFTNMTMIERTDPEHFYTSMRSELPLFFKPRELVAKVDISQNPLSKVLLVTVHAVPTRVPPDACCVRLTRMNNSWKFTPVKNGQVEMEWLVDMDEGGFVPYLLVNKAFPQFMYAVLPLMEKIMERDTYKNAKFDYIQDVNPQDVTAAN